MVYIHIHIITIDTLFIVMFVYHYIPTKKWWNSRQSLQLLWSRCNSPFFQEMHGIHFFPSRRTSFWKLQQLLFPAEEWRHFIHPSRYENHKTNSKLILEKRNTQQRLWLRKSQRKKTKSGVRFGSENRALCRWGPWFIKVWSCLFSLLNM